jgi:hypothetical protein
MQVNGRYKLLITGDTEERFAAGGASTRLIGYLFERLLMGEEAMVETELRNWGIRVELVDAEVEIPIIPQDQFAAAVLDATPEMIEAAWEVFDREGIEAPPAEVMEAIYRAMVRAR